MNSGRNAIIEGRFDKLVFMEATMKKQVVLWSMAILGALGAPGHAQTMKMEDMGKMEKSSRPAATHKAVGVVKKVDPGKGVVTLAHGPVKSLNLPAMTMSFVVKEKPLFDKLRADKKVEFEFVQQGKDYVITTVK